jgi:hypothetical protein
MMLARSLVLDGDGAHCELVDLASIMARRRWDGSEHRTTHHGRTAEYAARFLLVSCSFGAAA